MFAVVLIILLSVNVFEIRKEKRLMQRRRGGGSWL
jgi:hypothetical protein